MKRRKIFLFIIIPYTHYYFLAECDKRFFFLYCDIEFFSHYFCRCASKIVCCFYVGACVENFILNNFITSQKKKNDNIWQWLWSWWIKIALTYNCIIHYFLIILKTFNLEGFLLNLILDDLFGGYDICIPLDIYCITNTN